MLQEVARVLKPGGIAVITTENEESLSPANFYTLQIASRLARVLGIRGPASPVQDEAPTVAEMLEFTDLPVSEIAYECGFSSLIHLSTVFSKEVGSSPSAYRKKAVATT